MTSSPRILITGGAGFIGSNLAVHLRTSWPSATVVCLDNLYRKGSELNLPRLREHGIAFHRGDIRQPEAFPPGPFDYLVECSAEPSVLAGQQGSPDYLFQTNLVGAYHCLEKARQWGAGLLFLSTSRVYPVARLENHPWEETPTRFVWRDDGTPGITSEGVSESLDLTGARSLYGSTKLAAELFIEEYRSAYGLKAVVNRCGVIAGPWQFGKVDQGVIAHWVMAHLFERPLTYIGYGGQGKQVRDILHVQDLCELITLQLNHFEDWEGWIGNVAGGLANSLSLGELTDLCQSVIGRTVPITADLRARPSDLRIFIADCTRLFAHTTWRPERTTKQIVEDIATWATLHQQALSQL